jgi:2-polyprenyl-3-methyl-5-hydroxy-6-metoxy-1,4-benzoquinol methylase
MQDYRNKLYSKYNSSIYGGKNQVSFESSYEGFEREYSDILPSNKDASMLDVGCGMGHFVNYLRHKGFSSVKGVDHSAEQVNYCLSAGLPVAKIDDIFDFLNSQTNSYDFIMMSDVLEHFDKNEVLQVLEGLRGALRSGGVLVLRVPNMSSIYGLHGRYLDFTHEVGFTESSLNQVLMCAGFARIHIRDNKIPFGFAPKRFMRWLLFWVWRKLLNLIFLIEVGEDKPRLYGKTLVAVASI